MVSATCGHSGRIGMVGAINTQTSYVGARDCDPATTHRSLEKAVGEANQCDVDCTAGLSRLASGQPQTIDFSNLTPIITFVTMAT